MVEVRAEIGVEIGTEIRAEIMETLERLHAAQMAHDLDAMLAEYDAAGFVDIAELRAELEGLVAANAFAERVVDLSACEVFVHGEHALVRPVLYQTPRGVRSFSFHLRRGSESAWRIVDNRRSYVPGEALYAEHLVANAGQLVGSRGMLWIRRVDRPLEEVWQAVSTKQGLDRWWITRDVEIDLRPGGLFTHHWTNTVREVEVNRSIEFVGAPDDPSSARTLMRFGLEPDGEGTVFSFFDSFGGHPLPMSMPWTAAGWHGALDTLEAVLTDRAVEPADFGLAGEFYWRYLRERYALAAAAGGLDAPLIDDEAWRAAYLAPSI